MKTFVIDSENNVTVFATKAGTADRNSGDRFASAKDFASLAESWPSSRLVNIWNRIPGLPPVKKFMDRKTGIRRIWCALQQLEPRLRSRCGTLPPNSRKRVEAPKVAKEARRLWFSRS